jgi:polysaccharide biosynthesis protein PslJ
VSSVAVGRGGRHSLASIAVPLAVFGLLAVVVVANIHPRVTVPAIFLGTAVWCLTLVPPSFLAWRNLLAGTMIVILVIPIRRDALGSNLPFELEPYRLLVALLLAGWLVSLLVDPKVRLVRSIGNAPFLVVIAVTLASIVANIGRIQRLGVESEVAKSLAFFVGYIFFFLVIVSVARRFSDVDLLVKAVLVAGAAITFFALVESRTGLSIPGKILAAIPGTQRSFPYDPNLVEPVRQGRLRIFGSAQHPIELGAIFAMLVPLAVYLVHSTRRRVWWVVTGFLLLGAVASLSRTPVIMLLAILFVFLKLRRQATLRLWPLFVPAVVVAHAAAPGVIKGLYASFFPPGGLLHQQKDAAVGSGRLASLGPGLDIVGHHILLGVGFGSRIVSGPGANSFIVDDMWLTLGMELGILGVAAWLWLFVRFIRRMAREAKHDESDRGWLLTSLTASITACAVGMLTFDTFSFIQVTFLLYFMLALAAAVLSQKSAGPAVQKSGDPAGDSGDWPAERLAGASR